MKQNIPSVLHKTMDAYVLFALSPCVTSSVIFVMNVAITVATLALGSRPRQRELQGCGPRGSSGVKPRGSPGVKAKGSPGVTSHTLGSVRKCEGVNPHTPKATPTWGDEVPVDSRNFRERLQGSNLNGLWCSLYHWKALKT
jgi:hypothetical protein